MKIDNWPTIDALAARVNSGAVSAVDLVNKSLDLIEKSKDYNSVLVTAKERALSRAAEIDLKVKNKQNAGRLAGVPFIAKDNYLTFGTDTTASSNILQGFKAPYQGTVIEKLEAEGAIMVAKANLDSFAHGGSTENSDFKPAKNAHDPSRVPGGSSGGSATAVALGLAPFALGSDTGGSIRQPASFSGIVGFKPTYGSVSRYGVVSMVSSTDVMGPMASSVEDAALIYDVIAGLDPRDSTTTERTERDYSQLEKPGQLKIGVIKEHMSDGVDSEIQKSILETAGSLRSAGHDVEEVSIPTLDNALACYYIIMPAEVASNLAKFDGIRFGLSERKGQDLEGVYGKTRKTGFNSENKRRILIGNYVLSSGYYDAYYKKAQAVRTLLVESFKEAFQDYDVLIGPTTPDVAFKLGENTEDPLKMYLQDIMTVGMSLAGLPAISVPVSEVRGMPVGLQITGKFGQDKVVMQLAKQIEEARNG